jgi:glycosyltransferase involved in cell wall biosynthesis
VGLSPLTPRVPSSICKVAIVTSGFDTGGGVPSVARWLCGGLRSVGGYTVDVHDLATSSRDVSSRRLLAPKSWARSSLQTRSEGEDAVVHWGANAVEIETMRYRPRQELIRALQTYDIIQVVAGSPALAAAVIGSGVPVVLQAATTVASERRWHLAEQTGPSRIWRQSMTWLTSRVEHRVLRQVDAVLVENSEMVEYVRSCGQEHVVKAPPGVDTALFSPPAGGRRHDGYLLSVCRLSDARKGLERMLRAYAHMVRASASIPELVLAGKGSLAEPLQGLLSHLGLSSRVTIRSDVSTAELVELYRGAAVFLQTSYEEGLGLAVLEAMACALPVVSTDTAGTRETVVDGVTGWLVPQSPGLDVPRVFAYRVLDVLTGDGDALGARARERCLQTFSNDVTLRPFTDSYEELLSRAATR